MAVVEGIKIRARKHFNPAVLEYLNRFAAKVNDPDLNRFLGKVNLQEQKPVVMETKRRGRPAGSKNKSEKEMIKELQEQINKLSEKLASA